MHTQQSQSVRTIYLYQVAIAFLAAMCCRVISVIRVGSNGRHPAPSSSRLSSSEQQKKRRGLIFALTPIRLSEVDLGQPIYSGFLGFTVHDFAANIDQRRRLGAAAAASTAAYRDDQQLQLLQQPPPPPAVTAATPSRGIDRRTPLAGGNQTRKFDTTHAPDSRSFEPRVTFHFHWIGPEAGNA